MLKLELEKELTRLRAVVDDSENKMYFLKNDLSKAKNENKAAMETIGIHQGVLSKINSVLAAYIAIEFPDYVYEITNEKEPKPKLLAMLEHLESIAVA